MSVLSIVDGGFSVEARPLLRDVDLQVEPGEVVALLGANGSGKSTLVKAIVGLNSLTSGELRLFGDPVARFRSWARIGYVPQRNSAPPAVPATVGEVVASGRLSRKRPLARFGAEDRAAVDDALEVVGLAERRQHPVSILSGGQQQRVLVARALAGQPDFLVLDEPNAGVDNASQRALADALADRGRHGTTILVVLHELGPFEPLITRLLVMREGRLVHDGPPASGVANGLGDGFGAGFGDGFGDGHHHAHDADRPPVLPTPPVVAPLEGDA